MKTKLLTLLLALAMVMSVVPSLAVADAAAAPEIVVMMSPWVSTPAPPYDQDPYNRFLNETYGANFNLVATTEFETELMLRFTSDNEPDLVIFNSVTQLNTLYDQGVLLDDWTTYLDRMPQSVAAMGETQQSYFTNDAGKLIAMPTQGGGQLWSYHIRTDWLKNLGLEMPKTPDEVLEVMRAFTFNDPDQNGENDTYGFSAAGSGTSLNDMMHWQMMFGTGNTSFYIDGDTVNHPIMDGAYKEFLDFCRTMVSEGLVDPNWYTQGWDERKPSLFQGKFGFIYYPSEALLTEVNEGRGNDGAVLEWYDRYLFDNGIAPNSIFGTIRSVSAKCAEDPAKMDAIISMFEDTTLPNDAYYKLRYGYDIDGFIMIDLGGNRYINKSDTSAPHFGSNTNFGSLWNWGRICCTYADGYLGGAESEPSAIITRIGEMNAEWEAAKKLSDAYMLLNPDPTLSDESNRIIQEFSINYILGNTDDYEGFVTSWAGAAGDALAEDALGTFQKYGLM